VVYLFKEAPAAEVAGGGELVEKIGIFSIDASIFHYSYWLISHFNNIKLNLKYLI